MEDKKWEGEGGGDGSLISGRDSERRLFLDLQNMLYRYFSVVSLLWVKGGFKGEYLPPARTDSTS